MTHSEQKEVFIAIDESAAQSGLTIAHQVREPIQGISSVIPIPASALASGGYV